MQHVMRWEVDTAGPAGYLHQGFAVVILLGTVVNYLTADAVGGKTCG